MDLKAKIKQYLEAKETMQLATVRNGQPWLCSVHFVSDADLHIYWLSTPDRRHSKEIALDPKTAIAVAIKTDKPVIGVQATGNSQVVTSKEEVETVMKLYSAKHGGSGKDFYSNFVAGTNTHLLYRFTADEFGLFDEVNFAGLGRQKLNADQL